MMVQSSLPARLIPRGLGQAGQTGAPATPESIAWCSDPYWYWISFPCWGTSLSSWQAMAQLPVPPLSTSIPPPGAIPAATVSGPGSNPACAGMTQDQCNQMIAQQTQDAVTAAAQQAKQNIAQWAQGLPDNPIPTTPCEFMNISCTTWALIALAGIVILQAKR